MKATDLKCSTVKAIVVLATALSLTACGGHGGATSSGPTTITLSPQPTSVPVNGTLTFTATATNAGSAPIWFLAPGAPVPGVNIGSLSSGAGTTTTYTAPPVPPVFGPEGQGDSSGQGVVKVTAGVLGPGGSLNGPTITASFAIAAPEVTTGITPVTATVALGDVEEFYGYAVGDVNNGITWQVNGVAGGSASTGTIVNTGYQPAMGDYVWPGTYTAPAMMPMSGKTVTITVVSLADGTKYSSAVVTLN